MMRSAARSRRHSSERIFVAMRGWASTWAGAGRGSMLCGDPGSGQASGKGAEKRRRVGGRVSFEAGADDGNPEGPGAEDLRSRGRVDPAEPENGNAELRGVVQRGESERL